MFVSSCSVHVADTLMTPQDQRKVDNRINIVQPYRNPGVEGRCRLMLISAASSFITSSCLLFQGAKCTVRKVESTYRVREKVRSF
jgi:hypothetical protein